MPLGTVFANPVTYHLLDLNKHALFIAANITVDGTGDIPSFYPASVLQPVMKEVQEAVTQAVVKEMQQLHRMIGVS